MRKYLNLRTNIALGLIIAFLANTFGPIPTAQAGEFLLPKPGIMVPLSPEFNPPILKGLKIHPDNPFRFDFILDKGDLSSVSLRGAEATKQSFIKEESTKLIKYFLASLTIPEKDLWVNLSPYEKNRIIPQSFGLTEMGRDLLAEDYMLKQITASLIYPEGEIGRKFWKRIYEEAQKKFGTTNIPVNTFNKVWIVPEKAVVYENAQAGTAYIIESKLKVMLEQDYLAFSKNVSKGPIPSSLQSSVIASAAKQSFNSISSLGSQVVREVVIPELTKEVNQDKNFAQLRQVYNSLILATWYKKKIKASILAQVYENKSKVVGIGYKSFTPQVIYQRYLQAFKKGAYNYIKEEQDPITQQLVPRQYFSGGVTLLDPAITATATPPNNKTGLLGLTMQLDTVLTRREALGLAAATIATTAFLPTPVKAAEGTAEYRWPGVPAYLVEKIKKVFFSDKKPDVEEVKELMYRLNTLKFDSSYPEFLKNMRAENSTGKLIIAVNMEEKEIKDDIRLFKEREEMIFSGASAAYTNRIDAREAADKLMRALYGPAIFALVRDKVNLNIVSASSKRSVDFQDSIRDLRVRMEGLREEVIRFFQENPDEKTMLYYFFRVMERISDTKEYYREDELDDFLAAQAWPVRVNEYMRSYYELIGNEIFLGKICLEQARRQGAKYLLIDVYQYQYLARYNQIAMAGMDRAMSSGGVAVMRAGDAAMNVIFPSDDLDNLGIGTHLMSQSNNAVNRRVFAKYAGAKAFSVPMLHLQPKALQRLEKALAIYWKSHPGKSIIIYADDRDIETIKVMINTGIAGRVFLNKGPVSFEDHRYDLLTMLHEGVILRKIRARNDAATNAAPKFDIDKLSSDFFEKSRLISKDRRVYRLNGPEGEEYYVKAYDNTDNTANENLSYSIARKIGVYVPDTRLIKGVEAVPLEKKFGFKSPSGLLFLVIQPIEEYAETISSEHYGLEELVAFSYLMQHTDIDFRKHHNYEIFSVNGKAHLVAFDLLTSFDKTFSTDYFYQYPVGTFLRHFNGRFDIEKLARLINFCEHLDLNEFEREFAHFKDPGSKRQALVKTQKNMRVTLIQFLKKALAQDEDLKDDLSKRQRITSLIRRLEADAPDQAIQLDLQGQRIEYGRNLLSGLKRKSNVVRNGEAMEVPEPRAQDILKSRYANDLLAEIPLGTKGLGAGTQALVLETPEGDVIRFNKDQTPRPDIDGVLQPTVSKKIGGWTVERLPKVITAGITNAGVRRLNAKLEAQGYVLIDVSYRNYDSGNLGMLPNGEMVVIDSGAVQKKPIRDAAMSPIIKGAFVNGVFNPHPEMDDRARVKAIAGKVRQINESIARNPLNRELPSPLLKVRSQYPDMRIRINALPVGLDQADIRVLQDVRISKEIISNPMEGTAFRGDRRDVWYDTDLQRYVPLNLEEEVWLYDILKLLKGNEFEDETFLSAPRSMPLSYWYDWSVRNTRPKQAYNEFIHPMAISAVVSLVDEMAAKGQKDINMMDIFAGDGSFIEKFHQALVRHFQGRDMPRMHYWLAEGNEQNLNVLDAVRKDFKERLSMYIQIIPKNLLEGESLFSSEDNVPKMDIITSIGGGFNFEVASREQALALVSEVHDFLNDGGKLLITGFSEVHLSARIFEERGFTTINTSIPLNYLRAGRLKQMYIFSKKDLQPADVAMKVEDKGGIDLTSDKALTVQNNGQGIKFHIDPAQLQELQNAPGFVPVIISIEPMLNLRKFLGATS